MTKQYVDVELKTTGPDGEVMVMTGVATKVSSKAQYTVVTEIEWQKRAGKTIDITVTPAPLKEPTTPGARIELNNGSKWVRTIYPKTPWVCYSSETYARDSEPHGVNWSNLSYLSPKLVTD